MFDFLTLSVVIDDRIFCVHGGAFFSCCSHDTTRSIFSGDVEGLTIFLVVVSQA